MPLVLLSGRTTRAMREAGIDSTAVTGRGLAGARGLAQLLHRLNA